MSINEQNETSEFGSLAQNDPLMRKNTKLNKPLVIITLLIGMACIIAGIITYNSLAIGFIFFPIGALLLLLPLLSLWIRVSVRSNLRRKQQQREIAIQQSERFMLSTQPTPMQELPQPGSIKTGINLVAVILLSSLILAILWFIFNEILTPSWSLTGVLAKGITSILYGLVTSILTTLVNSRISKQSIEVSENGITTSSYGMKKNQIAWQDVRLFTTSANPTTPMPKAKKHPAYELVSAQTVVRWIWVHPLIARLLKPEPRMSRDEYDRWMEHLHGYIIARTNLPLLNLDAVKLEKGTQQHPSLALSDVTKTE